MRRNRRNTRRREMKEIIKKACSFYVVSLQCRESTLYSLQSTLYLVTGIWKIYCLSRTKFDSLVCVCVCVCVRACACACVCVRERETRLYDAQLLFCFLSFQIPIEVRISLRHMSLPANVPVRPIFTRRRGPIGAPSVQTLRCVLIVVALKLSLLTGFRRL
jgi:hypothetical protein